MKKVLSLLSVIFVVSMVSCANIVETQGIDGNMDATAYTSGLPAVELINAKMYIGNGGIGSPYDVDFAGDIEVENIAYHKSVKVVYSVDGGPWKETSASYVKSLGNNREHWKFSVVAKQIDVTGDTRTGYSGPSVNIQFALKYEVNGQVYWDNNGGPGVDYRISSVKGTTESVYGPAIFAKQSVVLTYATYTDFPTTYFRTWVAAKKVNGQKGQITVVYTTDGWNTVFSMGEYAMDKYENDSMFVQYIHGRSHGWDATIEFAIVHDVNGQSFWDNNVGENYQVAAAKTAPY